MVLTKTKGYEAKPHITAPKRFRSVEMGKGAEREGAGNLVGALADVLFRPNLFGDAEKQRRAEPEATQTAPIKTASRY